MSVLKPYTPASRNLKALRQIVGDKYVSTSDADRTIYSRDCNPVSIIWSSEGVIQHPPDFVVWPGSVEEVVKIVRLAAERKIPLVPFGAGSGVVKGTEPVRGGIALDLKRMDRILSVDETSLLVKAEAGIIGEHFEREMNRRGYTLGHFPSSIYCSTLGGWAATRSAGQLSTKYGKIEDMVVSLDVVLPDGAPISTREVPRSAAGPDLDQLFIGSEGTLGIITAVTMRMSPYPESRLFLAFIFPDVPSSLQAIRSMLRTGIKPAAMRVYDELDTYIIGSRGKNGGGDHFLDFLPLREFNKLVRSLVPGMIRTTQRAILTRADLANRLSRFMKEGCLMVLTFEGDGRMTRAEYEVAQERCEAAGGTNRGPEPARRWWESRYHVSYNQSKVFYAGAFVDTIEVAATWDKVERLYFEVRKAISPRAFIMAHFSHAYPEGCSIYFTFVTAGMTPQEAEKAHRRVWTEAMETCIKVGGTISHHHGIGLSRAEWMPEEHGNAFGLMQALKEQVDPENLMNPGKLGL